MSGNAVSSCNVAPETAHSDAGVAGAGILLAFVITAALALSLSSFIVFSEIRGQTSRTITRKLLSGLSDQQLVEGIGIQIVGLAKINSMIPYHFFIIWMLSLLSTATNFAALMALIQDFKRDWVLRWMRQAAMFVNMLLTIAFGVFVLETKMRELAPTLPVGCIWQKNAAKEDASERGNNKVSSIVGTLAVIAANAVVFVLGTWYLHMRRQRWSKIVRCLSLLALMAMAIGAAFEVIYNSQALGSPPSAVKLSDTGEREWSFGQLVAMLLLVLPFISALEIYRGQMQLPEMSPQDASEEIPLTMPNDGDASKRPPVNRYTFQPAPFSRIR